MSVAEVDAAVLCGVAKQGALHLPVCLCHEAAQLEDKLQVEPPREAINHGVICGRVQLRLVPTTAVRISQEGVRTEPVLNQC